LDAINYNINQRKVKEQNCKGKETTMVKETVVYEGIRVDAAKKYAGENQVISLEQFKEVQDASVEKVMLFADRIIDDFTQVVRVLKASGTFEAHFVAKNGLEEEKHKLMMQLLMQGLINSQVEIEHDGIRVKAAKPGFSEGASVSISLKKPTKCGIFFYLFKSKLNVNVKKLLF